MNEIEWTDVLYKVLIIACGALIMLGVVVFAKVLTKTMLPCDADCRITAFEQRVSECIERHERDICIAWYD